MQAVRGTPGWALRIHPQEWLHSRPWSIEFSSAGEGFEPPAAKEWSPARLSVRLPGLDSSNTCRIAFKSSVAEMMGKSRNKKLESASAAWSDLKRGCRSQKQNASGTNSSRQRLSSTSNVYSRIRKRQKTRWANLKPGLRYAIISSIVPSHGRQRDPDTGAAPSTLAEFYLELRQITLTDVSCRSAGRSSKHSGTL